MRAGFVTLQAALFIVLMGAYPGVLCADDTPPTPLDGAGTQTIRIHGIVIDVPPGTEVGQSTTAGIFTCSHNAQPIIWQKDEHLNATESVFSTALNDELAAAHYTLTGQSDDMFGDAHSGSGDELQLGGRVDSLKLDLCYTVIEGRVEKVKGTASMQVTWELYSPLDRKVIYKKSVTGATDDREDTKDLLALLSHAFKRAADALLADQGFHDLLIRDQAAAASSVSKPEVTAGPALILRRLKNSHVALTKRVNDIRPAVVTIFNSDGTGSGVVVSSDGYVLTDAHVVGGDKFVKLKLVTGREILGEVLRKDDKRDVALIKVEEAGLPALPIRESEPNIGEDVYALGASLGVYESTLTKGIVSAYRDGDQGKLIQSDVKVLPGNSGGPLMDADGNLIGLCEAGARISAGSDVPSGVNFFNPILDVLKALGIQLK
jgi:serine protease Do